MDLSQLMFIPGQLRFSLLFFSFLLEFLHLLVVLKSQVPMNSDADQHEFPV